jgi:hypothetical protein
MSVIDGTPTKGAWRSPPVWKMWFFSLAGIAVWVIHLTASAALVPYAEHHHWAVWLIHGLTLVLAIVAAVFGLVCLRFARAASSDEAEWSTPGRTAFIGWFGAVTGAVNVLLIVVEGLFVATIRIGGS